MFRSLGSEQFPWCTFLVSSLNLWVTSGGSLSSAALHPRLPVNSFRSEQSVLSASPSVCSSVLLSLRVFAQPPHFYPLPLLLLPLLLLLLSPLSLCGSEAVTRLSALLMRCLLSACLSLCFILSPIICLFLFALFPMPFITPRSSSFVAVSTQIFYLSKK